MGSLRGVQPDVIEKRLKCLFYGVAGAGKSTAAISFPAPYVIDTEKGITNDQYIDIVKKNGGAIYQCSDFADIITEVKTLLSEPHPYKTLVIDPLTTIYNDLVDAAGANSKLADPTAFGRHYIEANKQIKRLLQLLLRLDMNVIITSHAKNEYGKDMAVLGQTFDCYKKLDYLFDLVIEIRKHGLRRIGMVRKTRISTFEECGEFEFNYDEVAKRYGRDVIEREAVTEKLADIDQLKELDRLIKLLKIPSEVTDKWLAKANSSSFADMNHDMVDKCIVALQLKLEGKE